ncbi:MAG TPA: type II toxin-antitoxin system PemK/MazF family toxin [Gemmataceae bacterium]|nr:type II toxin-antitoxin system PemK/MazF family toxin [Gemmataceae bacterium]
MQRGEVWRVRLPPAAGRTQAGERPAVVIQNEPFLTSLPTVLIVPFTSKLAARRFAGTLVIQPDVQNGLSAPSVALVFQLSAQDKRNFLYRLGELDSQSMDQILVMVKQLTL